MFNIKIKNLLLYISLLILSIISLLNMQNAKLISNIYNNALLKQSIWIILGIALLFISRKINSKRLFKVSTTFYILSIVLLILVLFIGKSINGSKCWLNIFGISFQPSEFTKLSLILMIIHIIDKSKINSIIDEIKIIIKLVIITLIPSILVFIEPDTGAIINYFLIFLVGFYYAKVHKRWYIIFFLVILIFIFIIIVLYFYNRDILIDIMGNNIFYRIDRIFYFTNGTSYQLDNALITIGSSSFFGIGLNKILLYIPEAPTDFIFAFSIGNFGIISALLIIIAYLILDHFLMYKLHKTNEKRHKIFIASYLLIILFQEIYNIGMNVGLLPIMGITLPFISYGGTSIIINYLFLAIIINLDK